MHDNDAGRFMRYEKHVFKYLIFDLRII